MSHSTIITNFFRPKLSLNSTILLYTFYYIFFNKFYLQLFLCNRSIQYNKSHQFECHPKIIKYNITCGHGTRRNATARRENVPRFWYLLIFPRDRLDGVPSTFLVSTVCVPVLTYLPKYIFLEERLLFHVSDI